MGTKETFICRLCLKIPKSVHIIDDDFKEMLDILLLNLGWNFDEAVICSSCVSVSKKLCDFKLTCIKSEIEYDGNRDKKQDIIERGNNVCRLCHNNINRNDSVSLEEFVDEPMMEELFIVFMPEIEFDTAKKSTICIPCQENLENYSKLIQKYLATEGKINNYLRRGLYVDCSTQMLLTNVHKYSSRLIGINENENVYYNNFGPMRKTSEFKELTYKNSSGVTMYKCPLCRYETNRKDSIKAHSLSHEDVLDIAIYRCNLCRYKTSNKQHFERHKAKTVHKDISQMKTYKCTLCAYETKWPSHFRRHAIVHKGNSEVRIFKCATCPYETKWKHCMRSHQHTHDKNLGGYPPKMYKCTVCSFETHRKDSLENHSMIHKDKSSLKMYKCQRCAFETKWKHSFTKHQFTHKISNSTTVTDSNGTIYKCMSCTYETGSKKDMSQHSVIHKDQIQVKMYRCEGCAYETYEKYQLVRHCRSRKCNKQESHKDENYLQE